MSVPKTKFCRICQKEKAAADFYFQRKRPHGNCKACILSLLKTTPRTGRQRTYTVWKNIIGRCYDKRRQSYPRYGARGITVCDRWKYWPNFLEDMGEAPLGYSIDRIDNNGNYEPGNCRWTDAKTQGRNRNNNKMVTIGSETKCMADWIDHYGSDDHLARLRIHNGWDPLEALTAPRMNVYVPIMVNFNGTRMPLLDLCKQKNVNYKMMKHRIRAGWSLDEALETKSNRAHLRRQE